MRLQGVIIILTTLQLWFTVFIRGCNWFPRLRVICGHLMCIAGRIYYSVHAWSSVGGTEIFRRSLLTSVLYGSDLSPSRTHRLTLVKEPRYQFYGGWKVLIFLWWNNLEALISQIYFWNKTLHDSDSPSVHHQEFFNVSRQWYMSYRIADSLRAGSGRNSCSVLILLASCQQTCMTYTVAGCTVKNSWWWTEELSESCRVLFQK